MSDFTPEAEKLINDWIKGAKGNGHPVVFTGPAGTGKSHMLKIFAEVQNASPEQLRGMTAASATQEKTQMPKNIVANEKIEDTGLITTSRRRNIHTFSEN